VIFHRRPATDPDRRRLVRTRRVLAAQLAAAMMFCMIVVGVVAVVVVTRGERAAQDALLLRTAATAEDVVDPPPEVFLFELRGDKFLATPHSPAGLADMGSLNRVRASGKDERATVEVDGGHYLMLTRRRQDVVVQVAVDQRPQEIERRRLIVALGGAELVGLLFVLIFSALLTRRAIAPLGQALIRQQRFVADASHELRSPLSQVHTRAQLIDRSLRAGRADEVNGDVRLLVQGTRQLGEVIEDLLLSTQLSHQPQELTPVDMHALADEIVAAHAVRATRQNVELTLTAESDAPAVVRGRAPALRRVLTALVDNALSHTPAGGHVILELSAQQRPRCVVLVVRDDGTGFDPADSERLFARFARGVQGTRGRRRFGLGLALAQEVIGGHGGVIEAWGRPGDGAAFTIRLPASPS
jgi:signal transduction histidine kinase